MIDKLKALLSAPEAHAKGPDAAAAVAALLVEAARADANHEAGERALIERFLGEMFGFSAERAAAAVREAEVTLDNASDLVRFTRVVKTELPPAERLALLEALWAVVYSDGRRDPHEDALLRRLAPLIAVSDRDSAEARRRVAARLSR